MNKISLIFLFGLISIATNAQTVVETVSSGTSGDATLIIEADTDNSNEDDNPKIMLKQDSALVIGEIGLNGSAAQYTGALVNSMFIGTTTTVADASLQLLTKDVARITVHSGGNVGIGTTSPSAKLEVSSATTGDAVLKIESDEDNNNESDNARIEIKQDGGLTGAYIGFDADWGGIAGGDNYFRIGTRLGGVDSFNRLVINPNNGNIGIGTIDTKGFKLGVQGKIAAEEVKVAAYLNWADFVFKKDYNLPTLQEVENHIIDKGHLKDIPSAEDVNKNGIFLGEMDSKLLQKIEGLTLYTIQQEKQLKKQETINQELINRLKKLEDLLLNKNN